MDEAFLFSPAPLCVCVPYRLVGVCVDVICREVEGQCAADALAGQLQHLSRLVPPLLFHHPDGRQQQLRPDHRLGVEGQHSVQPGDVSEANAMEGAVESAAEDLGGEVNLAEDPGRPPDVAEVLDVVQLIALVPIDDVEHLAVDGGRRLVGALAVDRTHRTKTTYYAMESVIKLAMEIHDRIHCSPRWREGRKCV